MRALGLAAVSILAMAIGLATVFAPAEASAAFRLGGGGGGHFAGGMFQDGAAPFGGNILHGRSMLAFHGGNFFHSAGAERHAFAFDRGRRDFGFRRRHRHFFFVGGPFFGFDYGFYGYDCGPYWNGYRWVYPYGYGYSCGYGT